MAKTGAVTSPAKAPRRLTRGRISAGKCWATSKRMVEPFSIEFSTMAVTNPAVLLLHI